jgi:hypothetical protein
MEQSRTSEVISRSDGQEIPRPLWKPKVHYTVYKSLAIGPALGQCNTIHTLTLFLFEIYSNIIT